MRDGAIPPLPADLWRSVLQHIGNPRILLVISSTSHELASILDDAFWEARLYSAALAAVHAIAQPRAVKISRAVTHEALHIARVCGNADCHCSRDAFFLVMPHMAEAVVQVLELSGHRLAAR